MYVNKLNPSRPIFNGCVEICWWEGIKWIAVDSEILWCGNLSKRWRWKVFLRWGRYSKAGRPRRGNHYRVVVDTEIRFTLKILMTFCTSVTQQATGFLQVLSSPRRGWHAKATVRLGCVEEDEEIGASNLLAKASTGRTN